MRQKKFKIAITGGIGCGKSYVCHKIEELGFPIFYCDDEAKRIIQNDGKVRTALKALVGEQVYDIHGQLNKPMMREFLCQGKENAAKIDAIVHPRVAEVFQEWAEQQSSFRVFMECAILFESGFEKYVDQVLYVSAPLELRIERVMQRDHITREKALEWMSLQMPEEDKRHRSDLCINNDGKEDIGLQLREIIVD